MSDEIEQQLSFDSNGPLNNASAKAQIKELKRAIANERQRIDFAHIEIKGRQAARLCLERTAAKLLWKRLKSREAK